MPMHQLGFVYVLTNPAMPGLVKVGRSGYLPEDRAKQLFGTGVPAEYVVEFRAVSSRYKQVEMAAHRILRAARTNPQREFFRVAVDEAIEAVRIALLLEGGFDAWHSGEVQTLRHNDCASLSLQRGEVFFLIGFASMESMLVESPTILDIWGAHSDGDLLELHVLGDAVPANHHLNAPPKCLRSLATQPTYSPLTRNRSRKRLHPAEGSATRSRCGGESVLHQSAKRQNRPPRGELYEPLRSPHRQQHGKTRAAG